METQRSTPICAEHVSMLKLFYLHRTSSFDYILTLLHIRIRVEASTMLLLVFCHVWTCLVKKWHGTTKIPWH